MSADQISDAVIDAFLTHDSNAKVACETFVTTGLVVIGGEITTTPAAKANVDVQKIARNVINRIGYNKSEYQFDAISCGILNALHEQSSDIYQGVAHAKEEDQGAGDQGMMFGYACRETDNFMPLPLEISHLLLKELAVIRREGNKMKYLRPDAKSQVTIQYSDKGKPEKIETIVLSTQHDDFADDDTMLAKIKDDVINILIPRVKKLLPKRVQKLFGKDINYHLTPTGKFVIGGPQHVPVGHVAPQALRDMARRYWIAERPVILGYRHPILRIPATPDKVCERAPRIVARPLTRPCLTGLWWM